MSENTIGDILEKEIDEEVLEKMPKWFKLLYNYNKTRKSSST